MAVVLIGFLIIGLALPVLPLHVHQGLGLGTFVVGLVTGSQFAASLISRVWSGHYADSRGAKRAVVTGLLGGRSGGAALPPVALRSSAPPAIVSDDPAARSGPARRGGELHHHGSVRAGALALVDARHAGKVIAWVGHRDVRRLRARRSGRQCPLRQLRLRGDRAGDDPDPTCHPAARAAVALRRAADAIRPAFTRVIGAVWVPGIGMALSSVGFGAITSFISLLFVDQGWTPVWLAFSAFAAAFIVARVVCGHLPDRLGGARVALVSVLIEAAGQALIWLASGPALALTGAVLTGFG